MPRDLKKLAEEVVKREGFAGGGKKNLHVSSTHRVVLTAEERTRRRLESLRGRTGRKLLFAFSYEDIADLVGVKVESVRRAVCRRGDSPPRLDPASLKSICEWWLERQPRSTSQRECLTIDQTSTSGGRGRA